MNTLIQRQTLIILCLISFGCASGTRAPSIDFAARGRYSHEMHNRFYQVWVPPPAVSLPRGKISVPVDVMIDHDGRVIDFRIVRPSGNEKIDKSVAEVRRQVTQVAPPPGTSPDRTFKLRIYFELDVKG